VATETVPDIPSWMEALLLQRLSRQPCRSPAGPLGRSGNLAPAATDDNDGQGEEGQADQEKLQVDLPPPSSGITPLPGSGVIQPKKTFS